MRFSRRSVILVVAPILLAGLFFALYWRSLPFPYEFDDISNVIQNRAIRYLTHPRIFIESEYARSRPVTSLTFAVSYALEGLSLTALRLPSLFIHLFNAILVGLLFWRFFRRKPGGEWAAILAGGTFLFHPLATDNVIYLSGRASLLVLFFILLAVWFYGRTRPGIFSWLLFMVASAGAMLSKESAIVLLPILVVYHALLNRRWWEILPFAGPIVAGGIVWAYLKWNYLVVVSLGIFQIAGQGDVHSFLDYMPIGLAQWPRILALFFHPGLQAIDHQILLPASWWDMPVLQGIAMWLPLPALLYWIFRRKSAVAFCAAWLYFSLLVTNSVFPMLDPLAERHLYLALPAFAWMAGVGFMFLLRKRSEWWWLIPFAALGGFAFFVTDSRISLWRSSDAIWLDAYAKYPRKYRVVYNTWAALNDKQGADVQALEVMMGFLRATRPGSLTYEEQEGAIRAAAHSLIRLVRRQGGSFWKQGPEFLHKEQGFWADMVLLTATMGNEPGPKWLAYWQDSLERHFNQPLSLRAKEGNLIENSFYLLRGDYYAANKHFKAARADYEKVLLPFGYEYHQIPYFTKREALSDVYLQLGDEEGAIRQLQEASFQYRMFKRFPESIYLNMNRIYAKRHDLLRASDALGQLVRVKTDDPAVRQMYAASLRAKGDKSALQQTKESEYYSEHAIPPDDLREAVRP